MNGGRPLVAVIDDDALLRAWLTELLEEAGYAVVTAPTAGEGRKVVQSQAPALTLLDLRLPDANGVDALERLREIDHDMPVIMMTAYGEIETAVQAVKAGAYHFLQKPLDTNDLLITIEKGIEARQLRREVAVLREQHRWQFADVELVGRSSAIRQLVGVVEKVARSDSATVLLQGESGTGKDLVARAIHARSRRSEHPFLVINCTALPDHLVESELFGHERGAFTDARERKRGLTELADGGTLFLDEIGDMPPATQAKVLRFLEDSTFKRLGGTTDLRVDVRVIAATNRDLEKAVAEGRFRNDLYYRLKVVPLWIPPLRERREDIAPLAVYFIERLAKDLKRPPLTLTADAMCVLESYSWPGNVRELRNVLERALILEETQEINPEHLPAEISGGQSPSMSPPTGGWMQLPPEGVRVADVEHDLIRQALGRTRGNVTKAASLLGMSRDMLRYRLEKYGK